MEAIGAVASVIAVVELTAKISVSAASFMRDIKDARTWTMTGPPRAIMCRAVSTLSVLPKSAA